MTAFGFSTGGTIKPRIKYDAKAGRMFRVDRVEGPDGWQNNDVDITQGCAFLLNVNSACFGWVDFSNGSVQEVLVPYTPGAQPPARPAWESVRPTVEFQVKLSEECGGDIRRFATSAMSVIHTLGALHKKLLAAPEYDQGKVPAIGLVGVEAKKTNYGTNYVPQFTVAGWHDAPEEFEPAEALARGSDTPPAAAATPTAKDDEDHLDDLPFDSAPAADAAAPQGAMTF